MAITADWRRGTLAAARIFRPFLLALFALTALDDPVRAAPAAAASGAETILLRQGWWLASSAALPGGARPSGESLSSISSGFGPRGWQPVTLPSTVLSALVAAGVYPDPYFGLNLRSIPGSGYPIGANFSNLPMPPDSPFRASWWYRTRFSLPAGFRGKTVWLGFDGIDFRANVWLNGKPVATSDQMAGAWRLYRFDVTDAALPGADNALAVEIFPPEPHDLAITFVDALAGCLGKLAVDTGFAAPFAAHPADDFRPPDFELKSGIKHGHWPPARQQRLGARNPRRAGTDDDEIELSHFTTPGRASRGPSHQLPCSHQDPRLASSVHAGWRIRSGRGQQRRDKCADLVLGRGAFVLLRHALAVVQQEPAIGDVHGCQRNRKAFRDRLADRKIEGGVAFQMRRQGA